MQPELKYLLLQIEGFRSGVAGISDLVATSDSGDCWRVVKMGFCRIRLDTSCDNDK